MKLAPGSYIVCDPHTFFMHELPIPIEAPIVILHDGPCYIVITDSSKNTFGFVSYCGAVTFISLELALHLADAEVIKQMDYITLSHKSPIEYDKDNPGILHINQLKIKAEEMTQEEIDLLNSEQEDEPDSEDQNSSNNNNRLLN
jgi:hypothetical protein